MKYFIFFMFIFLLFACSNNNEVYWCGDHACINKKEKKAFFKKTMIVEKRELTEKDKLSKYDKNEILKQIRLEEKKETKKDQKFTEEITLEEKQIAKKDEKLRKSTQLNVKECFDWNVANRSIRECFRFSKLIPKPKKSAAKGELSLAKKESFSQFSELVEKINKKNASRPYPDINNIPN